MKTIRGIILCLNTAVSMMVTAIIVLMAYSGLGVWKVAWITFTGVIALYSILAEIEDAIIRRNKKNEKGGKGKDFRGAVPGVPWYKNRFSMDKQEDGDSRMYAQKVQKKPGANHVGQAVAVGKRD